MRDAEVRTSIGACTAGNTVVGTVPRSLHGAHEDMCPTSCAAPPGSLNGAWANTGSQVQHSRRYVSVAPTPSRQNDAKKLCAATDSRRRYGRKKPFDQGVRHAVRPDQDQDGDPRRGTAGPRHTPARTG